ncbi:hypothetical protein ER308_11745 [Egibacter rhizosphaerae]|uniref:Uncharacterized protein n=1 Tax=Egibacter rhizosphaerae TaxID=1670831 RepID=A0A411YG17_9ACTN|nr:hypothetical protein [Egibacter rhizosphaerae]QBI20170.1 hypothetical protein ER308_11745 [Egibacter rhizosphaerae]
MTRIRPTTDPAPEVRPSPAWPRALLPAAVVGAATGLFLMGAAALLGYTPLAGSALPHITVPVAGVGLVTALAAFAWTRGRRVPGILVGVILAITLVAELATPGPEQAVVAGVSVTGGVPVLAALASTWPLLAIAVTVAWRTEARRADRASGRARPALRHVAAWAVGTGGAWAGAVVLAPALVPGGWHVGGALGGWGAIGHGLVWGLATAVAVRRGAILPVAVLGTGGVLAVADHLAQSVGDPLGAYLALWPLYGVVAALFGLVEWLVGRWRARRG